MNPRDVVAQHRPSCLFNGMIESRHSLRDPRRDLVSGRAQHQPRRGVPRAVLRDDHGLAGEVSARAISRSISRSSPPSTRRSTSPAKATRSSAKRRRKRSPLPNTGMAVTIDIGTPENVHPRNKQDVGARLARIAKAKTYDRGGEWSGPVLQSAVRAKNALRLSFDTPRGA